MVPKRRVVKSEGAVACAHTAPAVVLPFPGREKPAATESDRMFPVVPSHGERPTHAGPALREWLRVALIVSLGVHAVIFVAFQLRFEDDLERAAGAAAARASDGSTNVLVEIVTTAALPSAPSPTDASETEADAPVPAPPATAQDPEANDAKMEELIPLPEQTELPPPRFAELAPPQDFPREAIEQLVPLPDTTPLEAPKTAVAVGAESTKPSVMPAQNDAKQIALPEEESAPPLKVEAAKAPEAPAATAVIEETPPVPPARQAPPRPKKKQVERKQARSSSPSQAAAPSRAAGANSSGRAGAGGLADAGGRTAISSYQAQVLAHLSRHRVYPPEARSRGATGVVRVHFVLTRDGRVISARLIGGSGERVLDEAGVAMVRRASPFPAFPPGLAQTRMSFAAPIRFDLR